MAIKVLMLQKPKTFLCLNHHLSAHRPFPGQLEGPEDIRVSPLSSIRDRIRLCRPWSWRNTPGALPCSDSRTRRPRSAQSPCERAPRTAERSGAASPRRFPHSIQRWWRCRDRRQTPWCWPGQGRTLSYRRRFSFASRLPSYVMLWTHPCYTPPDFVFFYGNLISRTFHFILFFSKMLQFWGIEKNVT